MKNIEEKSCLCALNRIFGFSPKTGLALISHFGSASEVFRTKPQNIDALLGPGSRYRGQIRAETAGHAAEEIERLNAVGIRFTGWTEDDYPQMLRECEDAPVGIYVRSCTPLAELWKPQRKIAVIGTRDISPYGKEWCESIVSALSSSAEKPVIVSGLALGTDIHAHQSAIANGLPTFAVMATGPDSIYPYRHRAFAERLAATPGCALITDYPPGTPPLAIHFIRRNRIIAGLSDATILIESKIKGGGMMTSRLAFSYNRDVYALPGRIDDIRSQGCNYLIRNKIAEPITSLEELFDSLDLRKMHSSTKKDCTTLIDKHFQGKIEEEKRIKLIDIYMTIRHRRGISIEELADATGTEYAATAELTGLLEIEGFINIDLLQRCTVNNNNFR